MTPDSDRGLALGDGGANYNLVTGGVKEVVFCQCPDFHGLLLAQELSQVIDIVWSEEAEDKAMIAEAEHILIQACYSSSDCYQSDVDISALVDALIGELAFRHALAQPAFAFLYCQHDVAFVPYPLAQVLEFLESAALRYDSIRLELTVLAQRIPDDEAVEPTEKEL